MSSADTARVLLDTSAIALAFRVGQLVEKLVLERGVAAAKAEGVEVVVAEHVEAGLDRHVLDEMLARLRESIDGQAEAN
ncbi:MAG: hypothetical protein KY475_03635 [Planctomycetes bacterium]|nr:hypothetical protein [Planctomycetota bacterium]